MHRSFDMGLFIPALILSLLGVMLIYTATFYSSIPSEHGLHIKQFVWLLIGIGIALVIYYVPLRIHEAFSLFYY
jgi:cell division protein FtsW (lipid II flippase)